jgi:hypothetical protein
MTNSFREYLKGIITVMLITLAVYVYDEHQHPYTHSSLLEIFGGIMLGVLVIGGIKEYNKIDEEE